MFTIITIDLLTLSSYVLLYTDVQEVVSHPPTNEFMAGSTLQMSATPISKVPGNVVEQKSPLTDVSVPKQQQQPEQPATSIESLDDSFTSTESFTLNVQSPKGIPQQGKWATPMARSHSPIPQQGKWATPMPRTHSPIPQQWATQNFGEPMFGQQGQPTNLLGEYQHHVYCGPATTWLFGTTGWFISTIYTCSINVTHHCTVVTNLVPVHLFLSKLSTSSLSLRICTNSCILSTQEAMNVSSARVFSVSEIL